MRRWLAAALFALGCTLASADTPVIAAASDLRFALEEIARTFGRERGGAVRLTFGSSGNFRQQISAGAPFELFMSADEDYVFALHREGRTEDAGVLYALGRLALFAPHRSPVTPDAEMKDLARALEARQVRRLAIANPAHAPYGRAAREALERLGLWEKLQGRLVLGESVSQAAQFAASPNAQAGILAYSLVIAPQVAKLGTYALLPEQLHGPLRQRMALVKGAGPTARAFYGYLQQASAREILARSGFALPPG